MDSKVFAKEIMDNKPLGLYYLIYREKKMHIEDSWELIKGIAHFWWLFKKYHAKNPNKSTTTSPLINKSAPPASMGT